MLRDTSSRNHIKICIILILLANSYMISLKINQLTITNNVTNNNIKNSDPLAKFDSNLISKLNNINGDDPLEVFITFFDIKSKNDFGISDNISIVKNFDSIPCFLIRTNKNIILEIAKLSQIKSITLNVPISLNSKINPANNPNEEKYRQTSSNNFVNFTEEVKATQLWNENYTGKDVVIAVLDTGIDITGGAGGNLDDFDDNTNRSKFLGAVSMVPDEPLYYSDLNGRGTFHAGIACGTGYLNKSFSGVAPDAYYLNVKIYDSLGITYWSFIISGIEWAIQHGADIILFANTIPGLYLDPVCLAIDQAVEKGVIVIAPIGDDGPSYMSSNTPGQSSKAITVGAYNSHSKDIWEFSSRGPNFDFSIGPDLIAPGVDIIGPRAQLLSKQTLSNLENTLATIDIPSEAMDLFWNSYQDSYDSIEEMINYLPKSSYGTPLSYNENYTKSSGSGAAAAVVAGCTALLVSAFPLASPSIIQEAMMKTAIPITDDLNSGGSGLIDVKAAFQWLQQYFAVNEEKLQPTSSPLVYTGLISNKNISSFGEGNAPLNYSLPVEQDFSAIFSTQSMIDAIILTNNSIQNNNLTTANYTSLILPLNQFGIEYQLENSTQRDFHWFSEFDVIREMHECINYLFYEEIYRRYSGILEFQGLYVSVTVETWAYCGDYLDETMELNITNPLLNTSVETNYEYNPLVNATRVNSMKISFNFFNERRDGKNYENLKLISFFKADMFPNEFTSPFLGENPEEIMNFTLDDEIHFNALTQSLIVSDYNNNSNYASDLKYMAMGFQSQSHNLSAYSIADSIDLLLNLTINSNNNHIWNTSIDNNFTKSGNFMEDLGFASLYDIGNITSNSYMSFNASLSVGLGNSLSNALNNMRWQQNLIISNVTKYKVVDTIIIETDTPRIIKNTEEWTSKVKIVNLGNIKLPSTELAFIVNKSTNTENLELYSIVYKLRNLEINHILEFNASWVPLSKGIFTVGWILGDSSDIFQTFNSFYETTNFQNIPSSDLAYMDVNILSNYLYRPLYIIDKNFYEYHKYNLFHVFPNVLEQKPMKLFVPLDYGIYNLTIFTSAMIKDVTIKTTGLGTNILSFLPPSNQDLSLISSEILRDIYPYSAIPIVLFANPFIPPGNIKFNITFTRKNEFTPFYTIPIELHIASNRGRVWFDATHLNFFTSENIVGTGALSSLLTGQNAQNLSLPTNNFKDFDNLDLNSKDGIDISQFFDLNERLDTTWGSFYQFRELWSNPSLSNEKGASINTIIPFLTLNLSEIVDLNQINFENSTSSLGGGGQIPKMSWDNFSTSALIPETSFLGNTFGNFSFHSEIQTTNYISHDLLQFFDGLVINDPEQGFLDREIIDMTQWVNEGGTLFIFAEDQYHNNLSSLNLLLKEFNLQIANTSFYPFDDYEPLLEEDGYYHLNIQDKINKAQIFTDKGSNIDELILKDPLEIHSLDNETNTYILGKGFREEGVIGVSFSGKGQVIVVGDNDLFKNYLIDEADNSDFAKQLLRWGLRDYYDIKIEIESNTIERNKAGFVDISITNYQELTEQGLMEEGLLFISAFFYENGSMINAKLYGLETPILPVFDTEEGHYSIWVDSTWYQQLGDWYVLIIIDHPAVTQELFYIKFTIVEGPKQPEINYWKQLTPAYPHYADIIPILAIVFMGIYLWYYDAEKYKTRLRITQLQGDYLNIAKTKLNEVRSQLKLLLRGIEKGDITEIERIRYLLSNQKQLIKFFKELKKFGESIGEHY